jgi:uncharacterized protein (TIGR03437 family)
MKPVVAWLLAASAAWGSNCSRTTVGFTPFINPYPSAYQGQQVSLYPTGNVRPPAHEALGMQMAAQVAPRDSAGNPDPNGKIVLLSVGMSNTTEEFTTFLPLAQADKLKDSHVLAVDGAVGGETAYAIATQPGQYWSTVDQRLQAAGVSDAQVQVIWLKEADANPTAPFPQHAQTLQSEIQTILQQARARFPNLRMAYLSSRIYAGYADSTLNPEPYAYEGAFAVKWLIAQQISGAPALDATSGSFPWLAWGPYLWADGLNPRIDGLTWACSDLQTADGTHPAPSGAQKVAAMLLDFFHSDSTARAWYLAKQSAPAPAIGAAVNSAGYGTSMATGSLATIFGTNLAGGTGQAMAFPLPHELAGTRVEIDGVAALVYYVSPTQINFVIPPEGGLTLQVAAGETASAPLTPGFVFWAPGLYTMDGAIIGPLAAEHAGGAVIDAAAAARRGETIQSFGAGLGFMNPLLLIPQPEPIVLVGGRNATVTYAGPAPGLPGVTQVNFTIPSDAPSGGAVPVVFQLGTAASNAATLAIAD